MIVFTFYSVLHILGDEHQMDDAGSWESNYQSFIRGAKIVIIFNSSFAS